MCLPDPIRQLHFLRTSRREAEPVEPDEWRRRLHSSLQSHSTAYTASARTTDFDSERISILGNDYCRATRKIDGHCEATIWNVQHSGLAFLHGPAGGMGLLILSCQHDHGFQSCEFRLNYRRCFPHYNKCALVAAEVSPALCRVDTFPGNSGVRFHGDHTEAGAAPRALAICAVIGLGLIVTSCAGVSTGPKATAVPPPVSYAVTINGNAGSSQFSTSVNVIVQ